MLYRLVSLFPIQDQFYTFSTDVVLLSTPQGERTEGKFVHSSTLNKVNIRQCGIKSFCPKHFPMTQAMRDALAANEDPNNGASEFLMCSISDDRTLQQERAIARSDATVSAGKG
eukprot:m.207376 g.207376  ORF g.207376 m.207376 type:complete len:114 (+) comp18926_c0_seq3:269-610(+)